MKMTMGLLAVSYPLWTLLGGVAGLVYRVSFEAFPGGGLGSQNLVFTLAVLLFAACVAAPILVALRRLPASAAVLIVVFAGNFGWLLPFMARTAV